MGYTIVDMKKWERKNEYFYFTKINPEVFSVTVQTDVTETYNYAKKNNIKFSSLLMYMITKAVNGIEQFRYGWQHGKLVKYDVVHPSFPLFNKETQNCRILQLTKKDSFSDFNDDYCKISACPDVQDNDFKKNIFTVSMEHRIHFTSFSFSIDVTSPTPNLSPSIITGKYVEKDGRLIMPFSLTVNHIVADGYHASLLFDKVQEYLSNPESVL